MFGLVNMMIASRVMRYMRLARNHNSMKNDIHDDIVEDGLEKFRGESSQYGHGTELESTLDAFDEIMNVLVNDDGFMMGESEFNAL